jgi:lysophospholipase L1-like esterase
MVAAIRPILLSSGLVLVAAMPAAAQQRPTVLPAPSTAGLPAVTEAAARAAIRPITVRKVILIGDSTMQTNSGWGGAFCATHLVSFVSCVNLARGGRGTFDYRAEGSWAIARAEMAVSGYERTYVLIQFGHNDQPGKPGRSTDLATEYPANLRRYVAEVRAAGAVPVLVTPLTRRQFRNGSLQDDLMPWAEAVRRVARETNTPLVDIHASSVAAVQAMGARAAADLAELPAPPDVAKAALTGTTIPAAKTTAATTTEVREGPQARPSIVFDYTHLGPAGAALFARQVADGLARAVPDLARDLIP